MSAIGINVTERDEVRGWESVKPDVLNRFKVAYREACHLADAAWNWYYEMCDQLEFVRGKYPDDDQKAAHWTAVLNDAIRQVEEAEKARDRAWDEMNCTHEHIETYGDNGVCEICGAKF